MTRDVSPVLDRHIQDRLGVMLRRRLDGATAQQPPSEIESLLTALREAGESASRPESQR